MNYYYTTTGPVRGSCGHKHKSEDAAIECLVRDGRAVVRGHGPSAYSDRVVVPVSSGPSRRS